MRIDEVIQSKYLAAPDLQGRDVTVTIADVTIAVMRDGKRKFEVHFVGKQKTFILNTTNTYAISDMYGPETDNWRGRQITLFPMQVDYQGKPTLAIRVRVAASAARAAVAQPPLRPQAPPPSTPPPEYSNGHEPPPLRDDEIPFSLILTVGMGALLAVATGALPWLA